MFKGDFPANFSVRITTLLVVPPELATEPVTIPVVATGVATNVFFVDPVRLAPVPVTRAPGVLMDSTLGFANGLYPGGTPVAPPTTASGMLVVAPVNVFVPLLSGARVQYGRSPAPRVFDLVFDLSWCFLWYGTFVFFFG